MTAADKYFKNGKYYCRWCAAELGIKPIATTPQTRALQRFAKQGKKKNGKDDGGYIPEEVWEALHPKNFDLCGSYGYYKSTDKDKKYGNSAGILAYSRWFHADAETRTPKNRDEVAKILGVSVSTLYRWEKMRLFEKAREKDVYDVLEYGLGMEISVAITLANMLNGSEKAVEIRNKLVERRQKDRGPEKNPFDWMDSDDLKEAEAIAGDGKLLKRTVAGKMASKDIDDALLSSDIPENAKPN